MVRGVTGPLQIGACRRLMVIHLAGRSGGEEKLGSGWRLWRRAREGGAGSSRAGPTHVLFNALIEAGSAYRAGRVLSWSTPPPPSHTHTPKSPHQACRIHHPASASSLERVPYPAMSMLPMRSDAPGRPARASCMRFRGTHNTGLAVTRASRRACAPKPGGSRCTHKPRAQLRQSPLAAHLEAL